MLLLRKKAKPDATGVPFEVRPFLDALAELMYSVTKRDQERPRLRLKLRSRGVK